jgi:hypothetical protein
MRNPLSRAFRALENFNFRLWTAGGLVSNIGTWMQRVAQDWIVLTQLTHHDATAVGIVTACSSLRSCCCCPGAVWQRTV